MKKTALCIALFVWLSSAFCADFGLTLDNSTQYGYFDNEGDVLQKDRATLWLSNSFSPIWDFYASVKVDYNYDEMPSWFGPSNVNVDLGRLEFVGYFINPQKTATYTIGGGRFDTPSTSAGIFWGRMDGAFFSYEFKQMIIRASLGYLGLQSKTEARVLMSKDDIDEYVDQEIYTAARRLVVQSSINFVELFSRHDLTLGVTAQFDLRALFESYTELAHTQYVYANLKGPLGKLFYHDAYLDIGIGQSTDGALFMLSAGYKARLYLLSPIQSRFEMSLDYASGSSGALAPWRPISQKQMGFVYFVAFTNCLITTLDASVSPLSNATIGLKGSLFLRTSTQELTDLDFDTASEGAYLGTELDAYVNFKLTSDFSLGVMGGVFLPNAGDTYSDDADPRWLVNGTATLSM